MEINMTSLFEHFKRNRRDLFIGIAAGLIVGAIALVARFGAQPAAASQPNTLASIANSVPMPGTPITAQSSIDDILGLMLNSHKLWKTLDANVTTVWQPAKDPQTVQTHIQIEQISKARLTILQYDSNRQKMFDILWVSDGKNAYEQDNLSKRYTQYALPSFAQSADDFGKQPPDASLGTTTIIRHPMAILIPSPVGDYLYPTGLMQRRGQLKVMGSGKIAARNAVIIAWAGSDENGLPTGKATFWVDAYTGVILKARVYGGDTWNDIAEETTIGHIVFDEAIKPESFSFTPAPGVEFSSFDEFYGSH